MSKQRIRIATRKSLLALWQANFIGERLKDFWPKLTIELVPLITSGDRFNKDKLQELGGKGLFVKELEEALLANRADIAVHSMKDVPAHLPPGLTLASFYKRDNPLDALVCNKAQSITTLPQGCQVGTTSLRRQAQLLALRPDLIIRPLRGNIHTRLEKYNQGEFDAIILAAAGLERMQIENYAYYSIDADLMLPACGQGVLGIECRQDDEDLQHLLKPLTDPDTTICLSVERQVNAQLGGNCHVPLGVYCFFTSNQQLQVNARVLSPDGKNSLSETQIGSPDAADELAHQCAEKLLAKGAKDLLEYIDP